MDVLKSHSCCVQRSDLEGTGVEEARACIAIRDPRRTAGGRGSLAGREMERSGQTRDIYWRENRMD